MSNAQTESEGIRAVQALIARDLGWFPREPVRPDYGIDLFIECAGSDGRPDGRMLAAQVKSGASYFRGNRHAVAFRGSTRHLNYWLGHSLPVIVILYDPATQRAIWRHVTEDAVELTARGWMLPILRRQHLNADAAGPLEDIARGGRDLRLNGLRADLTWMRMLDDGAQVFVEATEWLHKSSGRCDLVAVAVPRAGKEIRRQWTVYAGYAPYEEVFPALFPWADVAIDEVFYEWHDEDHWREECGVWDRETQTHFLFSEEFEEWRQRLPEGLRPYEVGDEVAQWRLELTLNELGKAFLRVQMYLARGRRDDE